MGYVVRMPQLGMTMEEGVVVEWTVDVGEAFSKGDVIAVVESEKTTNDIEAREDGQFLELLVDLEEPIGPGDPIAYVGREGESVPADIDGSAESDTATESASTDEAGVTAEATSPSTSTGRADDARVSPRARTYAREKDLDEGGLGSLVGTGPGGAVIEQDVIAATTESNDAAPSVLQRADSAESNGELSTSEPVSVAGRGIYAERDGSNLRAAIADRMTESIEAPQVTLNRRANVGDLLAIKKQLAADRDLSLSVTDFLLAALVETLAEHPELNGIYEDGLHKLAGKVNVGIAVDIVGGLVTPVIRGADRRTTVELREERQRLAELAQSGDYTMDDLSDGTFTVTNLGHFGVESFDPRLNPPEVGILGVGTIQTRYDPDADESAQELGLSLTFDHRAVDGADAARFLETLTDTLAHPLRLVSFGRAPGSSEPFLETDAAPVGDRIASAGSTGGMQADIRSRGFQWAADEPEDHGGTDTAPTPVEQFVGSLSSCLTLMIGHMADRRGTEVNDVRVTAQAHPPDGRIERIDVDVMVVSPASSDDVEQVVQMAERACYVNQVIDPDIDRQFDVTIETP